MPSAPTAIDYDSLPEIWAPFDVTNLKPIVLQHDRIVRTVEEDLPDEGIYRLVMRTMSGYDLTISTPRDNGPLDLAREPFQQMAIHFPKHGQTKSLVSLLGGVVF